MRKPQHPGAAVLVALVLSLPLFVQAQQLDSPADQTTARGIELYRQGKTFEAIKVLLQVVEKHKDDADAWYYLGLAQYSEEWIGGARDSFERLVELRPNSADAQAKLSYALILGNQPKEALATAKRALELGDQSAEPHYAIAEASLRNGDPGNALEEVSNTLKLKPDFLPALITKSFAHYSLKQYSESAESLERFLATSPNDADAGIWREQLQQLRALANRSPVDSATGSPTNPQTSQPVTILGRDATSKARVLEKPEAGYTEAARKAGVTGTVVLKGVFASDGQVKNLFVVRALSYGLVSKAVSAARRIKFEPAIKDGHSVSQYIQLEYTFNLY